MFYSVYRLWYNLPCQTFRLQIDIDLSLQFDISFTVVLNVASTVYPQMKFMLLAGCSNIQIACDA